MDNVVKKNQQLRDTLVETVKARFLKEKSDGYGYSDSKTFTIKEAEYRAIEALLQFEMEYGIQ